MPNQPSKEQQELVLREVAAWTDTPAFGARFSKFDAKPESTGIAESFELAALDPGVVTAAAEGKADIGLGIHSIHRWHHQMRVGNLPAYAESLVEEDSGALGALGTLVTDSPLASAIDLEWSKASKDLPAGADVKLLRSPDYALVAFVREVKGVTQCWIVTPSDPKLHANEKWLNSTQVGEVLSQLHPVRGFINQRPDAQLSESGDLPEDSDDDTRPRRSSGSRNRSRKKQ